MERLWSIKSVTHRRLMLFVAIAVVTIPLADLCNRVFVSREGPTVGEALLAIVVSVLGVALVVLGLLVRRTIGQLDSETRQLQTLFQSLAEGVVIHAADGRIVECNSQAQSILGLTRQQLLGKHSVDPEWRAIHEDGRPWPGEEHPAMVTLRTGESIRQAIMGVRLPGNELRWVSINTQAVLDAKGNPAMVVASFADVTRTREQMDRLDLTISGAGLGTWDWNVVTGQVVFNDIWAQMLGYDLSEVEPHVRSWERFVDRGAARSVMEKLNAHLNGHTPIYRSEHRLRRKDGSWMWVLDTGRVVERDSDGRPLRALGVHVDITATKVMEQRLRESDSRFLAIFDQTFHMLWVLTPDGMVIDANQTAMRFTGMQQNGMVNQAFAHSPWLSHNQPQAMQMAIARAAAGNFVRFELDVYASATAASNRLPDCHLDFSIKPVFDQNGLVSSLVAEALDITEAVRNRETLRLAQDRLYQATRNANLGVWDWNPQSDQAWFSEQWFGMLGYAPDEFPHTGSTWVSLLHPDDKDSALATVMRHLNGDLASIDSEFRLEFRMRAKSGTWNWILSVGRVTERDEHGLPTRVSGVHIDETERKQMQAQRSQAQRLQSIGQLAAGVAHEINTPMQFVSDNLEFLVEGLEAAERVIHTVQNEFAASQNADHDAQRLASWLQRSIRETGYERFRKLSEGAVRDCRDGCQRVVSIVHAMRQLSHPGTNGFHLANVNDVISGAATVTRNRWKFVADVHLDLDETLPNIPCRAAELSQVVVNMLVNAADAMPEPTAGTGELHGKIVIRSRLENEHVCLTVEDNGSGIPAHLLDKIFDPFFTTKPVGQGTGQGLAIAHDIIVNRHRGTLRVESDPGHGTTFIIQLPLEQPQYEQSAELVDSLDS